MNNRYRKPMLKLLLDIEQERLKTESQKLKFDVSITDKEMGKEIERIRMEMVMEEISRMEMKMMEMKTMEIEIVRMEIKKVGTEKMKMKGMTEKMEDVNELEIRLIDELHRVVKEQLNLFKWYQLDLEEVELITQRILVIEDRMKIV